MMLPFQLSGIGLRFRHVTQFWSMRVKGASEKVSSGTEREDSLFPMCFVLPDMGPGSAA